MTRVSRCSSSAFYTLILLYIINIHKCVYITTDYFDKPGASVGMVVSDPVRSYWVKFTPGTNNNIFLITLPVAFLPGINIRLHKSFFITWLGVPCLSMYPMFICYLFTITQVLWRLLWDETTVCKVVPIFIY